MLIHTLRPDVLYGLSYFLLLHTTPVNNGNTIFGTVISHFPHTSSTRLLPLPDDKLVSAGADGSLRVWDPLTGAQLEEHFLGEEREQGSPHHSGDSFPTDLALLPDAYTGKTKIVAHSNARAFCNSSHATSAMKLLGVACEESESPGEVACEESEFPQEIFRHISSDLLNVLHTSPLFAPKDLLDDTIATLNDPATTAEAPPSQVEQTRTTPEVNMDHDEGEDHDGAPRSKRAKFDPSSTQEPRSTPQTTATSLEHLVLVEGVYPASSPADSLYFVDQRNGHLLKVRQREGRQDESFKGKADEGKDDDDDRRGSTAVFEDLGGGGSTAPAEMVRWYKYFKPSGEEGGGAEE